MKHTFLNVLWKVQRRVLLRSLTLMNKNFMKEIFAQSIAVRILRPAWAKRLHEDAIHDCSTTWQLASNLNSYLK